MFASRRAVPDDTMKQLMQYTLDIHFDQQSMLFENMF